MMMVARHGKSAYSSVHERCTFYGDELGRTLFTNSRDESGSERLEFSVEFSIIFQDVRRQ